MDDAPELMGPLESRLLAVERKCALIDRLLREMRRQGTQQWQATWDAWADWRYEAPAPAPTPTATPTAFSGSIKGCSGLNPGAGIGVALKDGGGTVLWSGTTNSSGNYSGSVSLSSATPVTVNVTPLSGNQANTAGPAETLTPGVTHTFAAVAIGAAAGYDCTGFCPIPPSDTLNLAVGTVCGPYNAYPSDTLTYQSAPPSWASSLLTGPGWLGATQFTIPPVSATDQYVYWLNAANGSLAGLRQSPSAAVVNVAQVQIINCSPFSLRYVCGGHAGSDTLNATIS